MSIAPILLISFVSGYYFINSFYASSFRLHRQTQLIQYLKIGSYSVFLFIISFVIFLILKKLFLLYKINDIIRNNYPFVLNELNNICESADNPYLISSYIILLINFTIGILFFNFSRLFIKIPYVAKKRLENSNKISGYSAFDSLVIESIKKALPVSLTMQNDKVYIGFVSELPEPAIARKEIIILPLASGFRDKNKQFCFTTPYIDVYDDIEKLSEESDAPVFDISHFLIVLPYNLVQSANLFDFSVYNNHFRPSQKKIRKKKI